MKTVSTIIIFSICIISVKMFTTTEDLNSTENFSVFTITSNDSSDMQWNFTISEPTESEEIDEEFSVICKKCTCDSRKKIVSCGFLNWFNDEHWEKLDKQFALETIIIHHTHEDYIPILPTTRTRFLSIRYNLISFIEKGAFKNLKLLESLDLVHNNLTSQILTINQFHGDYRPYEFDEMKDLKEINLGFNRIDSLDANIFEYIPNLESLILCYNPIVTLNPATILAIKSINYLQYLDLSNTELSTIPDDLFENLNQLKILNLSRNHLTSVPYALGSAINLKQLNLDSNPIKTFERNSFPTLSELEIMSISNMDLLNSIQEYSLIKLQNLKTLYCSNNQRLVDFNFNAFYKGTSGELVIKELYLQNNCLTDINIPGYNNFDILDIRFNPLVCLCYTKYSLIRLMSTISKMPAKLQRNITCNSPSNVHGTDVADITSGKIDVCHHEDTTTKRPRRFEIPEKIIPLGSGIIVIILIIILFSLFIKCGWLKLRNKADATNSEYQRIEQ